MRGYKVLIDVLLPHGSVVRLKSGLVKRVFWATPPMYVPRDRGRGEQDRGRNDRDRGRRHGDRGREGDRDGGRRDGRLQTLATELAALSIEDLIQRERAQGPDAVVQTIECHRCPWSSVPRCDQAWRESDRIAAKLEQRRQTLEAIRGAYWQEFLRVVEVLEQFQAVRDRELTSKGHLIASLRHDNELLVAEVVSRGVFEDLSVAEAAAVCSTLIEESRSGEPNIARMFLKKHTKLRRRMDHVVAIAESVWEAQRARHLPMAVGAHPGFMPAVFRWASGDDDWSGTVEASFGGHEGDLIRVMRRLIDLLRQLADSDEIPAETSRLLAQAARAVDRGIVLESALV
jgi:hypothetical protein